MSKAIFSPNNINVLLHYHTQGFNPHPRIDAPAIREAIEMFLEMGCLKRIKDPLYSTAGCYETTAKGKAWVEALCRVECPRVAFVDGQGHILGYGNTEPIVV